MQKKEHSNCKKFAAQSRRWQWRKLLIPVMACIMVFCTGYALILPADTLEKTAEDSNAVHTHDETCYTYERGEQICDLLEAEGHTHDDSCYVQGDLLCQIGETESHSHSHDCYSWTLNCGQEESEGHQHSDACFERIETLACSQTDGNPDQIMTGGDGSVGTMDAPKTDLNALDDEGNTEVYYSREWVRVSGDSGIYGTEETVTLSGSTGNVHIPVNGKVTLVSAAPGYWYISRTDPTAAEEDSGFVKFADSDSAATSFTLTYASVQSYLSNGAAYISCSAVDANTSEASVLDGMIASAQIVPVDAVDDGASWELQYTPMYAVQEVNTPVSAAQSIRARVFTPVETYNVTIEYVFADDTTKKAAPSWIAELAAGSDYTVNVTSPTVTGYTASQTVVTQAITGINADQTIQVKYSPAVVEFKVNHYLQNLTDDDYTLDISETKIGKTGDPVGAGLAKNYTGFSSTGYDANTRIAADGSTEINIYYDRIYYLMDFNLVGGYGVSPVYARYGASIVNIDTPTKTPSTFLGWRLNGVGDLISSANLPKTMPAENRTYVAVWDSEKTAPVSIVIWGENADDTNYSYLGTTTISSTIGQTLQGTSNTVTNAIQNSGHLTNSSWWELNTQKSNASVVVAADGSSILNVYYNRRVYTFSFYTSGYYPQFLDSFSAKWGVNILDRFNGVCIHEDCWLWNDVQLDNDVTWTSYVEFMPTEDRDYYKHITTESWTCTANYMIQNLNTNGSSPSNYSTYYSITVPNIYYTVEEDYEAIKGFSVNWSLSPGVGTNYYPGYSPAYGAEYELSFYYLRNDYKIEFRNLSNEPQYSTLIPYETQLTAIYNLTPTNKQAPTNYEPGTVMFGGWYEDPYFQKPFTFDGKTKMPAAVKNGDVSLVLYAKWVPITHDVRFFLTQDATEPMTGDFAPKTDIPHRATIDDPGTPVNGEEKFLGWFYVDENGEEQRFNFSMGIIEDMDLYARWSSSGTVGYTVNYYLDGTTTPVADSKTGTSVPGYTETFQAKTGTELYTAYQTGCFPTLISHSEVIGENGCEYTFYYKQYKKVPYTVCYLDQETKIPVYPEKSEDTEYAVVTEQYVEIDSYELVGEEVQRLTLTADGDQNVIIFYYTPIPQTASLTIKKDVPDRKTEQTFDFNLTVLLNGKNYTEPLAAGDKTLEANEEGIYVFTLGDEGNISIQIPSGSVCTVTETEASAAGYITTIAVNGNVITGRTTTTEPLNGEVSIKFTNTPGYELPKTGGPGTYLYTTGGLLIMAAAILLYIHNPRRRKVEKTSF